MKSYNSITKQKGLKQIGYQIKFFSKKLWENSIKPFVLAAGTSAGKTIVSIISLEIFYSNSKNYNKRTLILAGSKSVLRDNFLNSLLEFNPSFGYFVATNKKELQEAMSDNSYQVIIALPQTIIGNYKLLSNIHNFILDEAHQWYFKPTIQRILNYIKPKKQLLLTGTPSKFVAKGNDFEFLFVPVMELYDEDLVSNIRINVVSSSYDFKQSDYLSSYGNLKANKTNSPQQAKEALKSVCDEMILKLRSRLGNKYLSNLRGANKIASMFNDLDKTIIFCHSLKQADAFHKELNSIKGLNGKVLKSHSQNDKDSDYFEMFRTQSQYKILVAVDRGRLGYNLPELFNVVDFTLTQSLDMILQMMGRVLRLSDKPNQKIYFKVATKNTAGYFVDLMTGALSLFTMEYYSQFNGKNMGGIQIPKVLTKTTKKGQNSTNSKSTKKPTQQLKSLEEMGIPLDLNLFRRDIMYSQSDKFGIVKWTTLDDCRREFFKINDKKEKNYWTYEKCIEEGKKYKLRMEFKNKASMVYETSRKNGWLDDVCAHMNTKYTKWNFKNLKNEALKYKTTTEFFKKSSSAYVTSKKMGLFEKITSHMEDGTEKNKYSINQYDKNNKFIKTYESLRDASRKLNIPHNNISYALNNKIKSAGGYIWKYKN